MTADRLRTWTPYRRPVDGPERFRLFCLPYAGGSARVYLPWRGHLPSHVELCAVQLPGRDHRIGERPIPDARELAEAVVDGCEGLWEGRFGILGHSMGALLAFEVARSLRRRGGPVPERLWLSGMRPPHRFEPGGRLHSMSVEALIERLREFGGTPEELLADAGLVRALLPMIRADFALCETYEHVPEPPLESPISAFAGRFDRLAAPAEVAGWERHTNGGFSLRTLDDAHFFTVNRLPEFVRAVLSDLREPTPVPDAD